MIRLENTSAGASKFWSIRASGNEAHIQFGKIGSDGRTTTKTFASAAEAQAYVDSKTEEKLRGGYVVNDRFVGTTSNAPELSGATQSDATSPTSGVLSVLLQQSAAASGENARPTLLSADAFQKLPPAKKSEIAINAERFGYTFEDFDDADDEDAKKIIGTNGLREIFDFAVETAETEQDAFDEDYDMGAPSVVDISSLRNDVGETIAYRIQTLISFDEPDVDVFNLHFADVDGNIFEQHWDA